MVFTIKYRAFLYIFPSSNSMTKVNVQNQACADDVPIVFLVGGAITI
jgi:hypothetical protein